MPQFSTKNTDPFDFVSTCTVRLSTNPRLMNLLSSQCFKQTGPRFLNVHGDSVNMNDFGFECHIQPF